MVNFYAILKKELGSYFKSPIAYMVIAVFSVISGYFFYSLFALFGVMSVQSMNNPNMQSALNITEEVVGPAFSTMSILILFMAPFLTMRLFSEEKKSGNIPHKGYRNNNGEIRGMFSYISRNVSPYSFLSGNPFYIG